MKKIAVGLSVGLNVVVLMALVWFFLGGGVGLFINNFIQPAHQRWVSQFEALPVTRGDVVFLGDSITEGGAWDELFPDAKVRNRGIGGDVTAGVLARLDQVSGGAPAQVFLLIGTNDLAFGVPQAEIVANIVRIIEEIRTASADTDVFVQSVLPRAEGYRQEVEALNAAIKKAVVGVATWIDLYPLFLDADGSINDVYSNDELHLHGAGYVLWRDTIRPYVLQ